MSNDELFSVPVLAKPQTIPHERQARESNRKGDLPKQLGDSRGGEKDICARKHHGNSESVAAFKSIRDKLTKREEQVLNVIREAGEKGATVDEISQILWTTPNAISGRCTSLKIKGKVRKIGVRKTRIGNNAAILVACP